MKTRNLLFLLLSAVLVSPSLGAPIITEFLATNQNSLADEDGERQDWIEIFNPDGTELDLSGYRLTDEVAIPAKWTFPAGAIVQPGGYLVIFASGKDRTVAGTVLHTNFSLESDGEYLAFSDPSGTILSEYNPFPFQSPNVSYGLISTTPGAQQAFFNVPTPGAANNTASAQAEAVQFSLTSRTFNQPLTLSVTLSVVSPTATIRYTTNRAVPTAASTPYTGAPITVTANTRIRARAFEPGRPDGPVISHAYFRLDAAAQTFTSTLPIVVTTTWGSTMSGDVTVPGHIMIFEPKAPDNLARMTNLPDLATPCSLERRGSSTAGDPKYSMTVEMWDESNNDRDFSPLGFPRESDWVMHAPYIYDRSFMHNDLAYRLSNELGHYAPRTRYVEHFHNTISTLDGIEGGVTGANEVDYFGVYSFMEKIKRDGDRVNIENMSTADSTAPNVQGGYIFKVDRLDAGDTGLRPLAGQSFGGAGVMGPGADLLAWVEPKDHSTDPTLVVTTPQYNYFSNYIGSAWAALAGPSFMDPVNGYAAWWNVPVLIDNHIINTATKNVDAMRLSAFWHKSRFGKLTAGPVWDFDRAQGSTDARDVNPNTWRGDVADYGTDFFHYPWYNEMFQDPNFWQKWVDRYGELRKGVLSTAHINAAIDDFANQLNPGNGPSTPAKRNVQKWTGTPPRGAAGNTPGTNGTYVGEVAWLKNWWASRLNFMDGQFARPATPSVADGPVAPGTTVTLTSPTSSVPGAKIYYTTNGTDPRLTATYSTARTILLSTIMGDTNVGGNSTAAIVPTSTASGGPTGVEWRGQDFNANGNNQDDFNHSTWFIAPAGTPNGVGYDDTTNAAVDYRPYLGIRWNGVGTQVPTNPTPVSPANNTSTMRNVNGSCYIRYSFTVSPADAALLVSPNRVYIHARYDDAFIAWINGVDVARSPVAVGITPAYNTVLGTIHDDGAATGYDNFDITANMGYIHAGQNILAVQLINATNTGSSDALFQVKMSVQAAPGPYTPGISPQAIEFTSPITITQPTELFVRTLHPGMPSDPPTQGGAGIGTVPNGTAWSPATRLYYFPGASSASPTNVQISEVNYHPPAPSAAEIASGFTNSNDFEFIRITNTGAAPVDLTGAYFSNGLEFTFTPGLQNWLPVGASVVVVENLAGFQSRYGTGFTVVGEFNGELDDGGEHIVLNDKTGAVIADFIYDDGGQWPTLADGERSLLYIGGDPNLATSWRVSLDPGGSGVTNYDIFKQRYFNGSTVPANLQGPNDDPDLDGIVNLAEFALALNPLKPDAPKFTNPLMNIRRRPAAGTNLIYSLQSTENPATGWIDGGEPTSLTPNADGTETAVYAPPNPAASVQILRMKITAP